MRMYCRISAGRARRLGVLDALGVCRKATDAEDEVISWNVTVEAVR